MIDEKIARVKKLIQQREAIDAELAALFGMSAPSRRGRPRKDDAEKPDDNGAPAHSSLDATLET